MPSLKIAAITATALLGSNMMIGIADAMPLNGLPEANKQIDANVQNVRLVCGPHGCWHVGPGWHRWGWRGRPGWHRWGWRGPGWHRWGWHPGWHRWG
jgi:hypothetical protein